MPDGDQETGPEPTDEAATEPSESPSESGSEMSRGAADSVAPSAGAAVEDVFSADEIFQRLTATALHEFQRTPRALWFSGLGAGLAVGAALLGRLGVAAGVGDYDGLIPNLLYPIGFVIVVIGRYQLYTENTLTPLTLVLTRRASIPSMLRLWGIVLAANLVGAFAIGTLFAVDGVLEASLVTMGEQIARHALEVPAGSLFARGVIAGGTVAAMVWLSHAVRGSTARMLMVYLLMLLIPVGGLFHVVVGAVEASFGVMRGVGSWSQALGFLLAVGLGNTFGGVVLVALLNFGQTRNRQLGVLTDQEPLPLRQWLVGATRDQDTAGIAPELDDAHVAPPERSD